MRTGKLTLEIFSPTIDNPIITPAVAKISQTAVEFANASFYDLNGDAFRVVAANIDVQDSYINYGIVETNGGSYSNVNDDTGFNGYALSFSALGGKSGMTIRAVDIVVNDLDIKASNISWDDNTVFVNVDGLSYHPDDDLNLNVGLDIAGSAKADRLTGLSGRDWLHGEGGKDILSGGAGADILTGGLGADKLTGGLGADRFDYNDVAESTAGLSGRDRILDFSQSQRDRIDLSTIDADIDRTGNQRFHFIGDDAFSKDAGEVRAVASGASTLVQGDVDGDGKADFAITLAGAFHLKAGDFIL